VFDPREYNRHLETAGLVAAYRYWEPASVYALRGVVNDHPGAVQRSLIKTNLPL
jgi:hypothetical protein